MASKNIFLRLKRTGIIMAIAATSFAIYVIIVNRKQEHMTTRQKLLKAIYPLTVWFAKTRDKKGRNPDQQIAALKPLYTLQAMLNDGRLLNLNDFKGKKILFVNTASDCGFTPQYQGLEKLYREHKEHLVILGFPANDFNQQEKGSDREIADFCRVNFEVSFPLMQKTKVIKGPGQNEIFKWLTDKDQNGWNDQPPSWNFFKYLVDEQGRLTHIFPSSAEPDGAELLKAVAE